MGMTEMRRRTPWQIQRAVISALVLRELKARFGRHRLGFIMVLLEPLLHLSVVLLMFGYVRGNAAERIPDFPVYLLVGVVPFLLFKNIAMRTMVSGLGQKHLLIYRQIHPLDIFVANTIIQIGIALFSCAVPLLLLGWLGFSVIPVAPLEWLFFMLVVVPFGFGFGLLLNVICRAIPEVKIFVRLSFMPLYFLSGVLHPLFVVPPEVASWLLWNPLLRISELSRRSFFQNYPMPYDVGFSYVAFVILCLLFVGLRAYRIRSPKATHVDRFDASQT